jgi:hypothetical protein
MITPYSTNAMLDVLAGKSMEPAPLNEDVAAHRNNTLYVTPQPWPMRLLPGFVKSWIAAQKYERSLVRLWEVSPHLLNDMGIVLTAQGSLPDHLVAAPVRVIKHVGAMAPEQIVAAEMEFPASGVAGASAQAGTTRARPIIQARPLASAL